MISMGKGSSFDSQRVPDTDSGSLFHFSHHCGIGHLGRFISSSHTVTGQFLVTILGEMTHAGKRMNPIHFGSDSTDILIQFQMLISFSPWRSVHSLSALVVNAICSV